MRSRSGATRPSWIASRPQRRFVTGDRSSCATSLTICRLVRSIWPSRSAISLNARARRAISSSPRGVTRTSRSPWRIRCAAAVSSLTGRRIRPDSANASSSATAAVPIVDAIHGGTTGSRTRGAPESAGST